MPKKIYNPHDRFFRLAMGNIEIAQDLFKANLPQKVLAEIDLGTLAIQSGSFVDEELKQSQTDILYHVKLKGDGKTGYLYILAEHQSTPEKIMAFRMIKYTFSIMQQHLNQGHQTLPLVYGLIVYTGKQTPYPYSTSLFDLFDRKALAQEILYQPFQLINVSEFSKKTIQSQRLARIIIARRKTSSFMARM